MYIIYGPSNCHLREVQKGIIPYCMQCMQFNRSMRLRTWNMDAGTGDGPIHVIGILYLLMTPILTILILFTSTLHTVPFYTTIITKS